MWHAEFEYKVNLSIYACRRLQQEIQLFPNNLVLQEKFHDLTEHLAKLLEEFDRRCTIENTGQVYPDTRFSPTTKKDPDYYYY